MSARGKRSAKTKVSFFAFQDIITCVSGVLIVVTLLMSTMLSDEEIAQAKPSSGDVKAETATLEGIRKEIQKLTGQLTNMPDPEAVQIETEELKNRLDHLRKLLAAIQDKNTRQQDRDIRGEMNTKDLERQIADALDKIKGLEEQVGVQQTKIEEESNVWSLVPQLPDSSRKPVLVVVSSSGATIEEFGQPDTRQQIAADQLQTSFTSGLARFRSADHYFVFYIKPSGLAPFISLETEAKKAGFQTGFDALLEHVDLRFSKPKK